MANKIWDEQNTENAAGKGLVANEGPRTPVKMYDGKLMPNFGGTRIKHIRWKPGSGGPKGNPASLNTV